MESDIKILEFRPEAAPEALWTAYFDHSEAMHREIDPQDPLLGRERHRAMLLVAFKAPYVSRRLYLALTPGGEAAGLASVSTETPRSPSYQDNKHLGNLNLSVLPGYRGRGLGWRLLNHVISELAVKEPAVAELMSPVVLEPGKKFCGKLGAKMALAHAENRLYVKDIDWAMVEHWAAEGRRRNPGTTVLTVGIIPEEDIKDYSEAYTEAMNQQPFGEISMKITVTPEQIRVGEKECLETGAEDTVIYTREANGAVSGLTETAYLKDSPHKVRQMLTGVRLKYRGRGLGKLLKALMLLEIRAKHPGVKYVVTGNADSNAPMLAINNALGFKKHLPILFYKLKLPVPGGR
ncbi:MAG: GNAT family N-acetyltransferase [Elusimicrobiales bacterium]|nr:GNAT family N-acetyltransferase [Elusimicrobiales bacterium]